MRIYDFNVSRDMHPVPQFKQMEPELSDDYDGHGDHNGHEKVGNNRKGGTMRYMWSNYLKEKLNATTKEVN
jgi:hypothetical protein